MGVFLSVLTVRTVLAEPPGFRKKLVVPSETLGPVGEMDSERVTVPLKPFKLVSVMVEVVVEACVRLREFGAALMEKSETMTRMFTVWVREPLVPVRITV